MAKKVAVTEQDLERVDLELTAARKRLSSPKEKIAWFRKFADADLNIFSDSERAIASWNLLGAIPNYTREGWPKTRPVEPLSLKTLKALQKQIALAFYLLFTENPDADKPARRASWFIQGPDQLWIHRLSPLDAKETRLEGWNHTHKTELAVMHGFFQALLEGGKYIRTCKRCAKAFVRMMRQEYCSTDCSQATRNETKKELRRSGKLKT